MLFYHFYLYTVTNIHTKAGILLKVFNVFRCENLALFTVTSIHSVRKSTKNPKNTEARRKATARVERQGN